MNIENCTQTKKEARKKQNGEKGIEIFKLSSWTKPRKSKTQKFWIGKKEDWELMQK